MALIEIRDLSKSFEENRVLRAMNLDVEKGSTVVILGKSGTGKSVLLKILVGLITPDSGSVHIDGREVVGMKRKELIGLRKSMGYLFQSAALYDSMSVRDNLAFPLVRQEDLDGEELEARIVSQLRLVGLVDAIHKMPAELSGGMKKRIGLARALITNPVIMLYDEPTTGLDPITSREISYLMKSLQERYQPTSIAVTHDMQCARIIADAAAILHDGTLDQRGTLASLERSENPTVKSFFATE
ncbi:MAG: ATP-binding cassette domain-containing protein [Ignavibacteriales bacterium]|nr:ATP-binding cassette domain-containing protein [Ignavibacteriales bacterium]